MFHQQTKERFRTSFILDGRKSEAPLRQHFILLKQARGALFQNLHAYFQSSKDHYLLLIHWQYHPFGSIRLVQFDEQVYFCMFYLLLLMCIDFWNYHRSLVLVFYIAQSLFCHRLKRRDNRSRSKRSILWCLWLKNFTSDAFILFIRAVFACFS